MSNELGFGTDDDPIIGTMPCPKCQYPAPFTKGMIDEATAQGKMFTVQHDVCPTEKPPKQYRVTVEVREQDPENPALEWELLASQGGKAEGHSLRDAVPELAIGLETAWAEIIGKIDTIDQPLVEKQPKEGNE